MFRLLLSGDALELGSMVNFNLSRGERILRFGMHPKDEVQTRMLDKFSALTPRSHLAGTHPLVRASGILSAASILICAARELLNHSHDNVRIGGGEISSDRRSLIKVKPWQLFRISLRPTKPQSGSGRCRALSVHIIFLGVLALQAFALDSSKGLRQYALRTWTSEQGLPQNSISCVLQTRDGLLWIGTRSGLARFDGAEFGRLTRNTFCRMARRVGRCADLRAEKACL